MRDPAGIRDQIQTMRFRNVDLRELCGIMGELSYVLLDKHGRVKQRGVVKNLVTDVGDEFYAKKGAGVAINAVSGMKLGTGTTAVAKNGAGAALVTYTSGSQRALDSAVTATTLGAGAGWRVRHITTWPAGVVTVSGLAEVVIVNESSLTDATTAAANTTARALLSPVVNKGASDTLAVTWDHNILGA